MDVRQIQIACITCKHSRMPVVHGENKEDECFCKNPSVLKMLGLNPTGFVPVDPKKFFCSQWSPSQSNVEYAKKCDKDEKKAKAKEAEEAAKPRVFDPFNL